MITAVALGSVSTYFRKTHLSYGQNSYSQEQIAQFIPVPQFYHLSMILSRKLILQHAYKSLVELKVIEDIVSTSSTNYFSQAEGKVNLWQILQGTESSRQFVSSLFTPIA
jgi:hypothetical protein